MNINEAVLALSAMLILALAIKAGLRLRTESLALKAALDRFLEGARD